MGTYFKSEIKIQRKKDIGKEFSWEEKNELLDKLSKRIIKGLSEPVVYTLKEMKQYLKHTMEEKYMDYYEYNFLLFNLEFKYFSVEDMNIKFRDYKVTVISK